MAVSWGLSVGVNVGVTVGASLRQWSRADRSKAEEQVRKGRGCPDQSSCTLKRIPASHCFR